MKPSSGIAIGLCSALLVAGHAHAADKKPQPAPAAIPTDADKTLEMKFTSMQAEIEASLPKPNDAKISAWLEAIKAEALPATEAAVTARISR